MGGLAWQPLAALLLVVTFLVGCDDQDAEPSSDAAGPVIELPAEDLEPPAEPEPPVAVEPANDCPSSHPREFTLTPLAPEFADLVADLYACTDESETSLHVENRSLAVWELVDPQLPPVMDITGDVKVDTFRSLLASRGSPPHRLLEPGRAMWFSMADGFLLLPDDAATALWQSLLATESVAKDHGLGALGDEFAGGAPGRKVAADCGLAAFDAVKALRGLEELEQKRQQAPSLYVLDTLSLATGTSQCATSLQDWRRASKPTAPAFTEAFESSLARTHQVGSFDDAVRWALLVNPRG